MCGSCIVVALPLGMQSEFFQGFMVVLALQNAALSLCARCRFFDVSSW